MEDKQLRIGVQFDDAEFKRGTKEAGQDVREMFSGIVKEAENTFKSYDKILSKINSSIEEMENKAISNTGKRIAEINRQERNDLSGREAPIYDEYRKQVSQKAAEARKQVYAEDRLQLEQVDLLRKLLEATQKGWQKEFSENRPGIEEELKNTPHRRRTFRQRYLNELSLEDPLAIPEDFNNMGGDFRRPGRGLMNTTSMMMHSRNPAEMAFSGAQSLGMQGFAGAASMGAAAAAAAVVALTIAGKVIYDKFQAYQRASGLGYGVTGRNMTSDGSYLSDYGYTMIDRANAIPGLARGRRSGVGIEDSVDMMLKMKRGLGLDEGIYTAMDQLSLINGGTGAGNIQKSIGSMRGAGILKGDDMSALPDYMQIMIQMGKEQLTRLGKIDMGVNLKMVSALGSMDETLRKSPEALSTMVNSIKGGLTGSTSPQMQALQYSVLSGMKPGASMFDLMKMKESPFEKGNEEYLSNYLAQLNKMSGGNKDRFMMNIMQQFGMSASMSEKLGNGYLSGNLTDIMSKFNGDPGVNVEERAAKSTAWGDKKTAQYENALTKTPEAVEGLIKEIAANREATNNLATEMQKSEKTMTKLLGAMVEANSYRAWAH